MDRQLSCIIVGETPDIQFLGWRLSLGHAFIVLVSQYVSSDGLVGWKSNSLGANYYTPNVFAKEVGELTHKLLDSNNGKCKYLIDVIIISGISIGQFAEKCKALSRFANPNTVVLVNASFGCELEEVALNIFDKNCKCVMSIACDVECRQLSLGSYALVNNDNCEVYLGLTYSLQNHSDGALLSKNEACVREELDKDSASNTNRLLSQLTVTKWIKVQSFLNPQEMAVKIWELIIPKISLNILSVIYEQFDYETLLKNKSNEIVFKDLVKELFDICYAQCNAKVKRFMTDDSGGSSGGSAGDNDGDNDGDEDGNHGDSTIDYDKIVEYCTSKKRELIKTTANEYPEYLSLSFETYCFYHRFEYPAHILLYQPILLAKKYGAPCSNLNFLYGFYSRLLSLSGLSIYGGRSESHMSVFDKQVAAEASSTVVKSKKKKSRKTKKSSKSKKTRNSRKAVRGNELVKAEKPHPLWARYRSNNQQGLSTLAPPSGNDLLLPDELGNLYLAAENMSGHPASGTCYGNSGYQIGGIKSTESDEHYSTAESDDGGGMKRTDSDEERAHRAIKGQQANLNGSCGRAARAIGGSAARASNGGDYCDTYYDGEDGEEDDEGSGCSDDDDDDDDDEGDTDTDSGTPLEISMPPKDPKGPMSRENSLGALEEMGVIGVPHFIKRFSPKTPNNSSTSLASSTDPKGHRFALDHLAVARRPYTTNSLELQLRTGEHLIAKEYDDLHRQLSAVDVNPRQIRLAHDKRRRTFANIEKELWKLQRRHNVQNRNISHPKAGPYEEFMDHLDILRRSNASEILDFTTNRYGNAEPCTIMQADKKQILSLYGSKLRGKRAAAKAAITRPSTSAAASSSTATAIATAPRIEPAKTGSR